MGRPSRAYRAFLLLAPLLFAWAARADEASDFIKPGKNNTRIIEPDAKPVAPTSCMKGIKPAKEGQFCDNVSDCRTFCSCACVFDPNNWPAPVKGVNDDGSTTCGAAMPDSGPGMLAPDSPELIPVPALAFIDVRAGARATQDAIDGLQRLSDGLRASKNREKYRFTIRLASCYRPHRSDSVPECGYVLKGKYMLAKPNLDEDMRKYWEEKQNPLNLGLAWPGMTPHSGGYACDLIMVDAQGQECFDWRAGVAGAPKCSIKPRLASSMMDEEVTNAGGLRLRYEAWHYEWGPNAKGCKAPACANDHWPPTGKP